MKKLLITCIFVFICGLACAQDRINLRDGENIRGKVILVDDKEIRYITDESIGYIYKIPRAKVLFILYSDGRTEVINNASPRVKVRRHFDTNKYPRYQGDFSYGYAFGLNSSVFKNLSSNIFETIHGVRINPHLFAGAGASYNYSSFFAFDSLDTYPIRTGTVALFGNLRYYHPISRKNTVYMSLEVGGNFFNKNDYGNAPSQLYYAIGPSYCRGYEDFIYMDIGIRFRHIAKDMNAIMLRIGFGF